jgi:hypothetical protein
MQRIVDKKLGKIQEAPQAKTPKMADAQTHLSRGEEDTLKALIHSGSQPRSKAVQRPSKPSSNKMNLETFVSIKKR